MNAEVDDAVSKYENELDEEERKEFTEERREELKNSLRESPAAPVSYTHLSTTNNK